MVQVDQLEILSDAVDELELFNEDLVDGAIAHLHLHKVGVIGEVNFGRCLERSQGFKLELLVIRLHHRVVIQVDHVTTRFYHAFRLLLLRRVPLDCLELLDEVLRLVLEPYKHDVEVAGQDAEIECKTELLLGVKGRDHLHMLQLIR